LNTDLNEIVQVMRRTHDRDISKFDDAFLAKSLDKRLAATGIKTTAVYGEFLEENRAEVEAFYGSLNIAFSEFFRNPLTFALMEQLILPSVVEANRHAGRTEIRIWSAACAAGQEAYSMAILLDELASSRTDALPFRIFATDHADAELASAKQGVYGSAAVQNVSLKHIQKYFAAKGDAYEIAPALRDRVDFSAYDLLDERLSSPAASIYGDFDLVFCSNLLFYYRPEVRQLILNKVLRALCPGGYLVTGEAERQIVAENTGFRPVFPPSTIFQKPR
jgi:chemotaxis methyl-accepting protein methylase